MHYILLANVVIFVYLIHNPLNQNDTSTRERGEGTDRILLDCVSLGGCLLQMHVNHRIKINTLN